MLGIGPSLPFGCLGFLVSLELVVPVAQCLKVCFIICSACFAVDEVVYFEVYGGGASSPCVAHGGCALPAIAVEDVLSE
jgi:hypothetical protein